MRTTCLSFFLVLCLPTIASDRIINGAKVNPKYWPQVVFIGNCSATVVGPRVIITAAHCARTNSTKSFRTKGVKYSAKMLRHQKYTTNNHQYDLAIGKTSKEIKGVKPATVDTSDLEKGDRITIMGYGCNKTDKTGGGKLRIGSSRIRSFQGTDMVLKEPNGSVVCPGDSGGPNFKLGVAKKRLVGVTSKWNFKDTSYNLRLDITSMKDFLDKYASDKNVDICGINTNCR